MRLLQSLGPDDGDNGQKAGDRTKSTVPSNDDCLHIEHHFDVGDELEDTICDEEQ